MNALSGNGFLMIIYGHANIVVLAESRMEMLRVFDEVLPYLNHRR